MLHLARFTGRVPGGAGTAGKEPEADRECAAVLRSGSSCVGLVRVARKDSGHRFGDDVRPRPRTPVGGQKVWKDG